MWKISRSFNFLENQEIINLMFYKSMEKNRKMERSKKFSASCRKLFAVGVGMLIWMLLTPPDVFGQQKAKLISLKLDKVTVLEAVKEINRLSGNSISYKREELEKEINRIENLDEENRKTKEKIEKIVATMEELCKQIEELREKNSKILNEKINEELVQLEMKNARFNAKVIEDGEFSINGKSHVEFVITTNLGEEEKKLNKIASGGEMSRIMLAIKTVLSDIDEVPVLIFDEIDTGISGKAANSVGSKLKKIAKKTSSNNSYTFGYDCGSRGL